ncbi:MAG: zinc-ribbon and DUF3426 domain-containing protein [Gammaproteobacteria bacterium]
MDYRPDNTQEFSSVTQCPYCHTAFHVGLAQLDAAAGRVRCGGCLRVFNAKEHFLVEQKRLFDDEPGMETGDKASIPETEESADSFFDVDLFGAEITDDDEPVILGSFNHYSGISIPRHAILDHKVDAFRQENYEHASAKEVLSEHEHLLESEDVESSGYISLSTSDQESDTDFLEISMTDSFEDFTDTDEIRAEPAKDKEFEEEQTYSAAIQPNADESGDEESDKDEPEDVAGSPEATQVVEPEAPADDFFIQHSLPPPGKAGALWWIALVLVFLALPVQVLFTQPDSLVIKSWFRQIGAAVCPGIGCSVPEYRALDLIRISGFIEPHPEYRNSLVAKIDLRNQGLAEQPFPPIAIYFRNLDGQITASRIFQPGEYIQGEARGYQNMPVSRNVQLELELLDPGEQSTSYELYIAN